MDELADEMRKTKQQLAGLEQDARQPRLAMEADVPVYRLFEERFDRQLKIMDELADDMRDTKQQLADFEQDARQSRLATEADVPSDTKNRQRMEGAAAAVQTKDGDSCFANQIHPDPVCLASFGDVSTRPPALPSSRDDALVGNGAAAPKSCLSPVEMRMLTAAGGLLLAGTVSTATMITFSQLLLWFCPTEEIHLRTSNQYAMDYISF